LQDRSSQLLWTQILNLPKLGSAPAATDSGVPAPGLGPSPNAAAAPAAAVASSGVPPGMPSGVPSLPLALSPPSPLLPAPRPQKRAAESQAEEMTRSGATGGATRNASKAQKAEACTSGTRDATSDPNIEGSAASTSADFAVGDIVVVQGRMVRPASAVHHRLVWLGRGLMCRCLFNACALCVVCCCIIINRARG
jgi:hypothetical protein